MFFRKSKAADQNVASTTTDNVPLPPNCEVLTTEWGSKVYLLGTNGFCQKCLQNVTEVIQRIRPSIVSIQSCPAHLDDIALKEEDALKKLQISSVFLKLKMFFMAFLGDGLVASMLYKQEILLSKKTGLASDADFRQALNERKKVPNCKLHLADLPEDALICRLWGYPSILEKWKYGRRLQQKLKQEPNNPANSHDLESSQEHRQQELETEFADLPAFKRVLISDRDRYLAYSLKKAAEPTETEKAPVVVGIVRNEHMDGIKSNWNKVDLDVDLLTNVEKKYVVYEALKYGAVMVVFTYFFTRRIRNRRTMDAYFNVQRKKD
uniref:TraB domain-containing protein-like n=1 Tax=Crassostrea virginica TaxID=6565 RepID=A0A8B8BF22_CRAVI|nr:traB domain-containing protein-like [Crassostrea virginica]